MTSQAQQEKNRNDIEQMRQKKRQTELNIQMKVVEANRRQKQLEDQYANQHEVKKQRVESIKREEEALRRQTQIRQKEIAMEKAQLQANIQRLRKQ